MSEFRIYTEMNKLFTSIKLAIKNLHSNKGRTALSLLGIVIGVASVVLILSLGAGLKSFVIGQVETFGTDIIEIEIKIPQTSQVSAQNIGGMIGGTQVTTLKIKDVEKVAKLPNIGTWYAGILSQQITSFEEKTDQSFIFGVTADMLLVDDGAKLGVGEFFSEDDDKSLAQVAVLGSKMKEKFFPDEKAIGKTIKIKGQRYEVIGVMEERGVAGAFDFDDIIFLPVRTLQKKIMGVDHIQFVILKVKNMDLADQTIENIKVIIREEHNIEYDNEKDREEGIDDDFAVVSIAEAKEMLDQIFIIIDILLLGIASISLVVGGVGIMNVMYVAVFERTKEIGLRKSVGARNVDILRQFIFESIILTLIGGSGGVLIGYILARVASLAAGQAGLFIQFEITWLAVLIGFGFSALIGVVFGFYPARKASRLTPAEALRKD